MRLHLLLPKVDPKALSVPSKCAYADHTNKQVQLHQPVRKALRDTLHQQVEVHRFRCLKCKRTFRVYPPGVSQAQSSDRIKGVVVKLYLLGLSYEAVSLALKSLSVPLSKTHVYESVQSVAARVVQSLLKETQREAGKGLCTMAGKRKQYSPEFKFKVVLESMQRDTTLEEVCRKFQVSSSMVSRWRQAFQQRGPEMFTDQRDPKSRAKAHGYQPGESPDELKRLIGDLTVQNELLKNPADF